MTQQLLTESPEKTLQQITRRETSPTTAQSFQGGLHPIAQLQRMLGNRNVAQLIQTKRLTPEGKIIGLQRKLTVGAADDQYEQEADRVARQVMTTPDAVAANSMQRAMSPEEDKDKMLQTKPLAASITPFVQRQMVNNEEPEDKEKPVQAKFLTETSREPLQQQPETEEVEKEPIQAKSAGSMAGSFEAGTNVETQVTLSKGRGSPLPDPVRTYMEPRFGVDFSDVRVHTGSDALQMNQTVGAQAFTHGSDIYFGEGRSPGNLELTAHELTHVVQQTGATPLQKKKLDGTSSANTDPSLQRSCAASSISIGKEIKSSTPPKMQRRLIVSGVNEALVNEYLTIVGTAAGLRLNWAFGQPRVTVGGNLPGAVPSPDGRSNILRVVNHATQHAELHIGTNQPRVSVGAFPGAPSSIQNIDIDDIRNLNASLPGQGTAKAFHEMMENFNAHGIGFGNFAASHAVGVEAESNVLENQGIVGRRLGGGIPSTVIPAPAGQPTGPNITYLRQVQNFTHYFLEIIQRRTTGSPTGPGADFEVVSAQRIPKIQVSQRTIDSFASGSNAIPPAGNVTLATALADLNGNPNSTILIEGFSDNVGSQNANVVTSRNRAAAAQAFFIANGINADRIAIVGRGETNFVATNANAAGRLQNRRIQLTVHRPGP